MRTIRITTPAGECPKKLKGTDKETVLVWADAVHHHGLEIGHDYAPSALVYYAGHFYDSFSDEFKAIREIIYEHYGADEEYRALQETTKHSIPAAKPKKSEPKAEKKQKKQYLPPEKRKKIVIQKKEQATRPVSDNDLGSISSDLLKVEDSEMGS